MIESLNVISPCSLSNIYLHHFIHQWLKKLRDSEISPQTKWIMMETISEELQDTLQVSTLNSFPFSS